MALRPLTAALRANMNAGYMSAACSAQAAARAPTRSKISQPGQHIGHAVGFPEMLLDQLDLFHANPPTSVELALSALPYRRSPDVPHCSYVIGMVAEGCRRPIPASSNPS